VSTHNIQKHEQDPDQEREQEEQEQECGELELDRFTLLLIEQLQVLAGQSYWRGK